MDSTINRISQRARIGRRVAALLTVTPLVVGLAPSVASACSVAPAPTTHAFARFGDNAAYSLVPGGSFEGGATGWTLNQASVVGAGEPDHVASVADAHSLAIIAGGSATSPVVCVDRTMPTFRFFARGGADPHSTLTVDLIWRTNGRPYSRTVGVVTAGSGSWSPSASMALATAAPLTQDGGSQAVQIEFLASTGRAAWEIDDVYLDPYVRGVVDAPD